MIRHFIFFALFLTGISAFSQEMLNHPKKFYVSPKGRLYVQKDLSIFLWLSTSPDTNAKKYL